MTDRVAIRIEGHVAEVKLNRPDKYNALDIATFRELTEAGRQLATDESVRAVVLHGAGRNFCAGLDLALFKELSDETRRFMSEGFHHKPGEIANDFQSPAWVWRQLPVPVIAALEGVVYGGGLQIALGPDIRLAAPDVKMSVMEIKWGLVPDMGATQTLRDLVGLDVAKELVFTGRVFDANEAHRLGLVTRLCDDPLTEARKLATLIAGQSPDAVRGAKRLLDEAWHADATTGLALEAEIQQTLIGTPNQMEAVMAGMSGRDPEFN